MVDIGKTKIEPATESQSIKTLMYMVDSGRWVTARELFDVLEINSPRKVISTLIRRGYPIEKRDRNNPNGGKPYKEYRYVGR